MKKVRDHYSRQAGQDNYPARSVYKLKEMDRRFGLLRPGQKVLDLGASPGSWSMFAAQKVQSSGFVLAVDLKEPSVSFPEHVVFIQADIIYENEARKQVRDFVPFDLVLSDMAPKTTGIKITDQARSHQLAREAFQLSLEMLGSGGTLVVKIFEGPDVQELAREMKACFKRIKHFKPKSSRAESKEIFLLGMEMHQKDS
ncbi:RlmE family RNA methyltransferase [Desulfonatronospira sp.]|uniref:RlmE family RNA methyltransferase n=1 Tax=Desulfonatronospira sp. TaxID=1962951 RepID=UPI0025C4A736|nr:RlmE family RNA methyltransferase [Desulfonatronospira sp.]